MICPNCGHDYVSGNKCPKCRLDTVLFAGTVKISDALYNKGLSRIKINDLSGAAEHLTKSVEINKNNINARNLLGLVLYETGHIGDSLKHWVISNSLMKDDNPAAKYIEEAQKSGRALERLSDAVRMYNQALEYIKQKSDDMAIIQLKKAIEINPKFVDAINLLTLCYLIQRDREKAAAAVERVLSMDAYNPVALNYYFELYPNRTRPELRTRKPAAAPAASTAAPASASSGYQRVSMNEKKNTNFHIAEILSFIIGAACMFAALYVLVLPAIARENEKQINEYQARLETARQDSQKQLEEKALEISERDTRLLELESDIADWTLRYDAQERTNRVLNAYGMLTDLKYQEAVDVISGIDTAGLASDIIEKADNVNVIAYPKLSATYYEQGTKAYKEKDYTKALVDLEKAYRYTDEEASIMPDLLYYLGFTYALSDETAEDAIALLTTFTERYPNSKRIKEVKQKLTSLQ